MTRLNVELWVVNLTFEHKLGAAHHACGEQPAAVAPSGVDAEGRVFADRVRVMVVTPLPRVVVVVEDEVAREEQNLRPDLAAPGRPVPVKTDRQVRPRREDGRVEGVGAGDDPAGDAAVVVILRTDEQIRLDWCDYEIWLSSEDLDSHQSDQPIKHSDFIFDTHRIFTQVLLCV